MKEFDNQLFTEITNEIKDLTFLSHTSLAKRLNYSKSVYFHLRSGKTPPKPKDFEKLVKEFPDHTVSLAIKLGMDTPKKSSEDQLFDALRKMAKHNKELDLEIKELKEVYQKAQSELMKTNADQREQINKLIDLLSEKTKAL